MRQLVIVCTLLLSAAAAQAAPSPTHRDEDVTFRGGSITIDVTFRSGSITIDVTFRTGSITIAGTLSLPSGSGPFPAVVLLSGTGPQNRDSKLFGFRPFKLIADAFARAVSRC